jgi:hypothetical protein
MGFPLISYDVDLIIKKEQTFIQSNSGISTNTTLTFDNIHNLQRDINMTLTLNSALSSLTISSITGGHVITINPSSGVASGEILSIYKDSVYRTSGGTEVELSGTTFSNGLFHLEEDYSNQIRFTISPISATVDGVFSWIKPSDVSATINYAEGFGYTENRELIQKKNNVINKYVDKYYTNNITNDFNIDKLYFDTYFIDENCDTYQIEFKTSDEATDVQNISVFLCGAKFTSLGWNSSEGDMVKEGIRGSFCKKIKG